MANTFNKNPKTTLLIITLIFLIIIFLVVEIVLRFTPFQIFVTKGQSSFPSMFVKDDVAGFDFAENYKHGTHSITDVSYDIHSNNLGCYDDQVELNKKHNVIIGDSFTWGFSPLEKKWTSILEKNSNQRFVKCGVMAYGTKQSFNKLKKINKKIGETPKTIIFGYYWNDLNDDHTNPSQTVVEDNSVNRIKSFNYKTGAVDYLDDETINHRYEEFHKYGDPEYSSFSTGEKIKFWIKSNSIIANLVHNGIASLNKEALAEVPDIAEGSGAVYRTYISKMNSDDYPWINDAWDKHLKTLEDMRDYAKSLNSKFMIVIMPTKHHVYPKYAVKDEIPNIKKSRQRLKSFLATKNIPFLDLFPEFSKAAENGEQLYLSNDLHFNVEGEALAGKLVSDFVKDSNFLVK